MSRAKRVVLHVGTMKSGTSYLQSVLRQNATLLAGNGILIPERMVAAAADALGNAGRKRTMDIRGEWQRVRAEIEAWDGDQVIASHEFFGAATPEQAEAVVASLRPHDVEVVVGARDLQRVIPSHWQTIVKSARTIAFSDYASLVLGERPGVGPEEHRLFRGFWMHHDVSQIVGSWCEAAGDSAVTLLTVPPSGAEPTLLWERFAAACGIDPAPYNATPDHTSNVSLSFSETEMLRQVNQALDGKMTPKQYRLHVNNAFANRTLRSLAWVAPASDRPRLSLSQQTLVAQRAQRIVDELGSRGLRVVGELSDLLVEPATDSDDVVPTAAPEPVPGFAIEAIARLLLDRTRAGREPGEGGGKGGAGKGGAGMGGAGKGGGRKRRAAKTGPTTQPHGDDEWT